MKFRFWFVAFTFAVSTITSQNSAQARPLRDLLSHPTAADAMSDVYGKAVADVFAQRLWEQGSLACKSERKLDQAMVKRHSYEILMSFGAKLVSAQYGRPGEEALAAQLDELAGAGSSAELGSFSDERII